MNTGINCVHETFGRVHRCRILKDEIDCDPRICGWHCTPDQMIASFRKARENYKRRHGADEYFQQQNIVPAAFRYYGERAANDET